MYSKQRIESILFACLVNRNTVGQQPWSNEPDRKEWFYDDYPCLIQRSLILSWCGYVGIQKNHPFFGKEYDEISKFIGVHGGVTFSGSNGNHICCENDNLWWFGFDCAHFTDEMPLLKNSLRANEDPVFSSAYCKSTTYRDMKFVIQETEMLAEQLKAFEGKTWEEINAKQQ